MDPYVVRQGEYLSLVAHRLGVEPDAIWSHSRNRALRELRADPEVLAPGDVLYVPRRTAVGLPLQVGADNRFRAEIPMARIRVALRDGETPIRGAAFVVEGADEAITGTTDGDGAASFEVPVSVAEVRLRLTERNQVFSVRVGHLDPVTEPSGVLTRLQHLGLATHATPQPAADPWTSVRGPLAAFQRARGLEPTGALDDRTRDALVAAHGS